MNRVLIIKERLVMSKLIIEVCRVKAIEKHPNADKLSVVTIKDWSCIVGLDQYEAGDLVVFVPPDSVVPEKTAEKYNLEYLRKNGRVRTVKLRGFISQGLVLSIPNEQKWKEGQDVAKYFGIVKYEPPTPLYQNLNKGQKPTKKKRNPLFDKYTSIENVKNYTEVFKEGEEVVILEKIHGTSFRAGRLRRYKDNLIGKLKSLLFGKYEFVYGSHNVQIVGHKGKRCFYGEDVYGRIAKKYNLAEILPEDHIIYGEIYGKGIQGLEYGMKDIDVVFFDVKYKGKYLDYYAFRKFCMFYKLPKVPVLYLGEFDKKILDAYTKGNSVLYKGHIREGCITKPITEEYNHSIGRKVLKSINAEYLLKKDRTDYK